jgi:hypothetical protein
MIKIIYKISIISIATVITLLIAITPFVKIDEAYGTVEDYLHYMTNPFLSKTEPYNGILVTKSYHKFNDETYFYELRKTNQTPSKVIELYEGALKSKDVNYNVERKTGDDIYISYGTDEFVTMVNAYKNPIGPNTVVQKTWKKVDTKKCSNQNMSEVEERAFAELEKNGKNDPEFVISTMQNLENYYEQNKRFSNKEDAPGQDLNVIKRYPGSIRKYSLVYNAGETAQLSYVNKVSVEMNAKYYTEMLQRNGWKVNKLSNALNTINKEFKTIYFVRDSFVCNLIIKVNDEGYTESSFFLSNNAEIVR